MGIQVDESALQAFHLAGLLLVLGGVVFTIGAFSPPWEQWRAPVQRALEVVGTHRRAWYWIHACFAVGVVATILGFVAFAHGAQLSARAALGARLLGAVYAVGAVFWLINIAFRCTVQVWAATEVVQTGTIPATYLPWARWAALLFAGYMVLAYLACAGLGWWVLGTALVPRWAGWFALAFGLSAGAWIGRNIPFMVHIPLILVGALLLRL